MELVAELDYWISLPENATEMKQKISKKHHKLHPL